MPRLRVTPELVDAGKRASDIVNLHLAFTKWDELKNKWIAFRLSDGGSDGVLYDTKQDAVKHQLHEMACAYVCYRGLAGGSTATEMGIFLQFSRDAYDAGFRLPDPDSRTGGPDVLMTAGQGDYYRKQLASAFVDYL